MPAFVKKSPLFFAFILISLSGKSQLKELTNDQYFKSNFKEIVEPLPVVTGWIDNNHFSLLKDGRRFTVDAQSGTETETQDITKIAAPAIPGVYTKNVDLFIKLNGIEVQLTSDNEKKSNPVMSPNGNYVAFTKKNDLYTVNINTKKENRLTTDGSDVILNGYASWVYMEEILGRAGQYRAFWWSPDSKKIAYFRSDDSKVPVFTITNAKGLHGEVENTRYPKVGDPNPAVKVGIISPEGGESVWTKINEQDDQYFGLPYWKPDGSALLVQWMPRSQDQLKIYEVNPLNGELKEFYTEQQKTWINLDDEGERISFVKNGKGFILRSDKTGWNHLYYYDIKGKLINAITSGKFTVTSLEYIDEKTSTVYFTARGKENTARKDYYRVSMNGSNLKRLTFGDYNHSAINPSPDGAYFITTYSNTATPTKVALISNKGKLIKELGDSKGAAFKDFNLAKTELLRVNSDDGLFELPMKVTWPVNMDATKKYPVLISIYGGPNAGTCWDSWSISGPQQWYAKEGLIQVVMDHRASGHFGKEGVNYMYRDLGHWELLDYSTMVKWLIANKQADPAKICITGFSYGGYMSTLALTKGADLFTHAMAGGPVTEWTLYDSHYTERFMDLPNENPEGYRTGNVMNYVNNYKGMLQIVHGEIDDNVHMQNSIQLISKLQDAKKDFEMMIYPGGRHGWSGNKGLHFQNLKTQFIYKYLLEKPVNKMMLK
ncbi:MAG: DPP IV N-terminal domain-containing protein [Ferruginibacter sp.]